MGSQQLCSWGNCKILVYCSVSVSSYPAMESEICSMHAHAVSKKHKDCLESSGLCIFFQNHHKSTPSITSRNYHERKYKQPDEDACFSKPYLHVEHIVHMLSFDSRVMLL